MIADDKSMSAYISFLIHEPAFLGTEIKYIVHPILGVHLGLDIQSENVGYEVGWLNELFITTVVCTICLAQIPDSVPDGETTIEADSGFRSVRFTKLLVQYG